MNTLEDTLVNDEIITESGRVFRPAHKELLENLPPDMVQELARRRMKDIQQIKALRKTPSGKNPAGNGEEIAETTGLDAADVNALFAEAGSQA